MTKSEVKEEKENPTYELSDAVNRVEESIKSIASSCCALSELGNRFIKIFL